MKDKLVKAWLFIVLGCVVLVLSLQTMDKAAVQPYSEKKTSCFSGQTYQMPVVTSNEFSAFGQTKSSLLGYLFQLMFILFFISPPVIAVMLFLIWKELKERNKMK